MKIDPLDPLPRIPKSLVMQDYRTLERGRIQKQEVASHRGPTLALRLALSVFGSSPREGIVPLRFFAEENIQIYLGLPSHPLNRLFLFARETTARKIVDAVFPKHRDSRLSSAERFALAENLPIGLEAWLEPIQSILESIIKGGWDPPPIYVLNFRGGKKVPWIARAEHLCGQVADGTHRVLAYTMLGSDFPDISVRARVLSIHPVALAFANGLTLMLRFILDPFRVPEFIKKRFGASACFSPQEIPLSRRTDSEESSRVKRKAALTGQSG